MKNLILLAMLCLLALSCQAQELFLGKTEAEIRATMQRDFPATFKEKTYTNDGNAMLGYQFPTDYVEKHSLEFMFFLLGDDGRCINYTMGYYNRNTLTEIVDKIKSDYNFVKLENKFTFTNLKNNYQIQIRFMDGDDGFEVVYVQGPKKTAQ